MNDDAQDRIRRDLTTAALEQMETVVNMRANMAAAILPNEQVAMMLFEIATSLVSGACIFVAQNAKDDTDTDALVSDTITAVARVVSSRKPAMLAIAAALRGGADPADVMKMAKREGMTAHG